MILPLTLDDIVARFHVVKQTYAFEGSCALASSDCRDWIAASIGHPTAELKVVYMQTKYPTNPSISCKHQTHKLQGKTYIYTDACILQEAPTNEPHDQVLEQSGARHEVCAFVIDSIEYLIDWSVCQFGHGVDWSTVSAFAEHEMPPRDLLGSQTAPSTFVDTNTVAKGHEG